MILVNISAVATSTTLTSIPVNSFHFGPEKCSGSSDCRPASHTIVIVVPEYFLASFTARSAALWAHAAAVQPTAITAAAVSVNFLSIFILVLPDFSKTHRTLWPDARSKNLRLFALLLLRANSRNPGHTPKLVRK